MVPFEEFDTYIQEPQRYSLRGLAQLIRALRARANKPGTSAVAAERYHREADELCRRATLEQNRRSEDWLLANPDIFPFFRVKAPGVWSVELHICEGVEYTVEGAAEASNPQLALYRAIRKAQK